MEGAPNTARNVLYDASSTHSELAKRTVALATGRDGSYRELSYYANQIQYGAIAEDADVRFVHHFWNPTSNLGLPNNSSVYLLIGKTMGAQLYDRLPVGGHLDPASNGTRFLNSLDWATNGMPDDLDWEGAISAYDYTESARARSYEALGHVLHLLEDLAQPDHARDRPHPGNLTPAVLASAMGAHGNVGYETLWALEKDWPRGRAIVMPTSLDNAFRSMAAVSRQAELDARLPAVGENALGLKALDDVQNPLMYLVFPLLRSLSPRYLPDTNWEEYELQIPIVPTIPYPNDRTQLTRDYLALGAKLLPKAEEHGAGLLRLFHDIVLPPPYVESVRILQQTGNQLNAQKYAGVWTDHETPGSPSSVRARSLHVDGGALESDVMATVEIKFGPAYVSGGAGQMSRRAMSHVRVTLEKGDGSRTDIPMSFLQNEKAPQTDGMWIGHFLPTEGGTIVIEGRDAENHFAARNADERGSVLDTTPGVPAKANVVYPYAFAGYDPGPDRNHRITVSAGGCAVLSAQEIAGLRWSQVTGSTSSAETFVGAGVSGIASRTTTMTVRANASNAEVEYDGSKTRLNVISVGGGAEGTRVEMDTFNDGAVGRRDCSRVSLGGAVFLKEGTFSLGAMCLVVGSSSGRSASSWYDSYETVEGKTCGSSLSGRDGTVKFDFKITPVSPPPFARFCDAWPRRRKDTEEGIERLIAQTTMTTRSIAGQISRERRAGWFAAAMSITDLSTRFKELDPDSVGSQCDVIRRLWLTDLPPTVPEYKPYAHELPAFLSLAGRIDSQLRDLDRRAVDALGAYARFLGQFDQTRAASYVALQQRVTREGLEGFGKSALR